MRVCHIGNPNSLNIKIFIEFFSRQGHEVHTFGWGPYIHEMNENIHHHDFKKVKNGKNPKKEMKLITKDTKITPGKRNPYAKVLFDIYEFLVIKHKIRKIQPDIIHGHEAAGNGYITSSFKKIPTILTCWGSDINKFPRESKWIHYKVNRALHDVDLIHVTNEDFGKTISKDFNVDFEKIRNIPWGVETEVFDQDSLEPEKLEKLRKRFGLERKDMVITYPAGFRDSKLQNYVNLVKAFAEVSKKYDNVKLLLMAYNRRSGIDEVTGILDREKLWDRVRIIDDYLPHDDMPYVFGLTDIMTLLHDVDQMSVSISESMLMGCVNLFSSINTYRNAFKDNEHCIFVNQKDPKDIAEKLTYMIENLADLKGRFSPVNMERIKKNNSRDVQMRKIEDMYGSIMK